jgi:hypothetical protein
LIELHKTLIAQKQGMYYIYPIWNHILIPNSWNNFTESQIERKRNKKMDKQIENMRNKIVDLISLIYRLDDRIEEKLKLNNSIPNSLRSDLIKEISITSGAVPPEIRSVSNFSFFFFH